VNDADQRQGGFAADGDADQWGEVRLAEEVNGDEVAAAELEVVLDREEQSAVGGEDGGWGRLGAGVGGRAAVLGEGGRGERGGAE